MGSSSRPLFRRCIAYFRAFFHHFPKDGRGAWLQDPWAGDVELGKHIANHRFILAGGDISFPRRMGWYAREATLPWLRALHGFGWMRDMAASQAIPLGSKRLRLLVEDWITSRGTLHATAHEPEVVGERLTNWLFHGVYLTRNSTPAFQRRFLRAMQADFFALHGAKHHDFSALKGLVLGALILPGCGFAYVDAQRRLLGYIRWLLEGKGRSAIRNPVALHGILRGLIELRAAQYFKFGKSDASLDEAIESLAEIIDGLRHGDGGFALFNGAIEDEASRIDETLAAIGWSSQSADATFRDVGGYGRIAAGQSRIFMDIHAPLSVDERPFHGTHSFEWSHGGQRIVVNCGASSAGDKAWDDALRSAAAHSTLSPCGYENKHEEPSEILHRSASRDGYVFCESVANDYLPLKGLDYRRQLLINDEGTRFSGADSLQLQVGTSIKNPFDVHLRFHLHPQVKVKRLMNGIVLMQLEGEEVEEWTFQSSVGQAVEVDESVYLGAGGKPQASKQIVIFAPLHPDIHSDHVPWLVEWSFIKRVLK